MRVEQDDRTPFARRTGWRAAIGRNRYLEQTWRMTVLVVGLTIIAGGVVLLPLPGPGWLIIFIGLGVLATEFEWAHSLLQFARRHVHRWSEWVQRQSLAVRFMLGVLTLLVVALAVWGYDAFVGFPSWVPLLGD